MQLSSMLIVGLGLASTTSGYVLTLYKGENCGGTSQRRNIYDNTCATTDFAPMSVRVEVYGGYNQKAYFYSTKGCIVGQELRGPWTVNAFGSRA
ncbi:hypothetical protein JMJ77_0009925 [Colletotrichum scovillei]|uniref:Uncharacterized protein n=1 Tax=Colletotrichum scovillei TaxID=1209932 RepID=A0A9P7QV44_9PEZI|nr:hypothetical protein JMJ78_0000999 [Colletotrichum scovillei]KAG7040821.1 hypothetical protein JMJ77_0009925 [Colletotrichum scovillei]KAG7060865.1 hypothetical protein JMJ76_0009938 [Colletotrichum scovillei]